MLKLGYRTCCVPWWTSSILYALLRKVPVQARAGRAGSSARKRSVDDDCGRCAGPPKTKAAAALAAAQRTSCRMWTSRPLPAAKPSAQQAEVAKAAAAGLMHSSQADAIVAAGKAAVEVEHARTSCARTQMHRLHRPGTLHVRKTPEAQLDRRRMMHSCWTICWRKQVQSNGKLNSVVRFFADNRIVKASLRCAHKLWEKDRGAHQAPRSKSSTTPRKCILNVSVKMRACFPAMSCR